MDWAYPKEGTERTALAIARIAEITAGLPRVTELRPADARRLIDARWAAYARSLMTGKVSVTDHMLPLPCGPMRVRMYEVSPPRLNPRLVIFLHGGGWVMRSPETSDFVCEQLAIDLDCSIASLDYPLAPENPCPVAVEACVRAIRYMAADRDGMWPRGPYGICGESAGANIALATIQQLKGNPVAPAAALLVYGVYDSWRARNSTVCATIPQGWQQDWRMRASCTRPT